MKWQKITTPEKDNLSEDQYMLFGKRDGDTYVSCTPIPATYDAVNEVWHVGQGRTHEEEYNKYLYCSKVTRPSCRTCAYRHLAEPVCGYYEKRTSGDYWCETWEPGD